MILRQYAATAFMEAGGHVNDSALFIFDYALRFVRVAAMLSIWRMIFAGRGPVNGMGIHTVLTYALIAEVFAELLAARTYIEHMIWEGNFIVRLLRPQGLFSALVPEAMGRWIVGLALCSIPLLLAAPLIGVDPRPASLAAGLWFIPSLILAVLVGLALDFTLAAVIAVMNVNVWIMDQFRAAISTFLSGAILPLALMPWGLGRAFEWLPFASMASAPLRVYTGTGDPRILIAIQLGWAALLWPVAQRLWLWNREKIACYGG